MLLGSPTPLLSMYSDLDFQILQKLTVTWLKSQPTTFRVPPFTLKMEFPLLTFLLPDQNFHAWPQTFLNMKISYASEWYFTRFLSWEGKEKQSRYESKCVGLTQPISIQPDYSHRTQSIMTLLPIYVYVNVTFLYQLIRSCHSYQGTGAFTTITDPSVSLSSHEVVQLVAFLGRCRGPFTLDKYGSE